MSAVPARNAARDVCADARGDRAGHHPGARGGSADAQKKNRPPFEPCGRSSDAASSSTSTGPVLGRVRRPFPIEPIRTLDAVHLATAELLGEPPQLVTIVTRDARVRENAKALGYAVA